MRGLWWLCGGVVVMGAAVGCVRGEVSEDADSGCLDDFSCPAGFICSIDPLSPTDPGECVEANVARRCSVDEDCFRGQECINQTCVDGATPPPNNDQNNDPPPNNDQNNDVNNDQNNDQNNDVNNDPPPPTPCDGNGDCEVFEECCDGSCVDRGSCVEDTPCTAQGQPCVLPAGEPAAAPGNFVCALLVGDTAGTCLSRCTGNLVADVCPTGSYCLAIGDEAEPVSLCLPSECDNSFECADIGENGEDGTCVRFDNSVGLCFGAGNIPQNGACNINATDAAGRCDVDLFCITGGNGPNGTCRSLCDMWNNDVCPNGQACGLLTQEAGVCLDQTPTGRVPFDTCNPPDDWCATGSRCFTVGEAPNTQNLCLDYCRPGTADCNGVFFQGQNTICNNNIFVDENQQPDTTIGLCLPPEQ